MSQNPSLSFQKINDVSTYVLIALLFAPHASKECVKLCDGAVFISPYLFAVVTPYVKMDISLHGFLIQFLWSIPFIAIMWMLFRLRDRGVLRGSFQIYMVRWTLFFIGSAVMYNLFFWGGFREFIFPSFIF
jgi:hypothetical protein